MFNRHRSTLIVTLYALLTALMTFPTIARFTTAIPGDGFDGWQNYWNQWWIKEAILNRHTSFFFTDMLYPPDGVNLIFQTFNYFNGLWTLPIQLNFGLTAAYNAVVFFHFTLAGFGVYLLARYTLAQFGFRGERATVAAFIGGAIFTFSPFHMAHLLGHMQVFSLTWNAFYVLWLVRTLNNWQRQLASNPTAAIPKRDLALSGLFLTFVTAIDWYQTLYMVLFTALITVWLLWRLYFDYPHLRRAMLWKPVVALAAMGVSVGVLFSPLIVPMAREAATADYMRPSFAENVELSADVLAFITPSELHPLWGKAIAPFYRQFSASTSEQLIFVGIVPLLLTIFAAVRYRRRKLAQFWLWFVAVFFVLALGPYLHIGGKTIAIGGTPIPLPYLALYKTVPFIGISRSLSRYALMVMMGVGVLSALALVRFNFRWQMVLGALIAFEFAAIPYPMSAVDTPAFFRQIAAEPGTYTIAYLPMNWDRPAPLLYQTVHHKKLLTAYISRENPHDLSWRTPVLQEWRTLKPDIIQADLAALAPTVLHDFGVKYIVLDYYQMPPGTERDGTERWVAAALPNQPPVFRDERLTVYQTPPLSARQSYLQLGDGWGKLTDFGGQAAHIAEKTATLRIVAGDVPPVRLTVGTIAPHSLANLAVTAAGVAMPLTLSTDGTYAVIALPDGVSAVQLHLPQPTPITLLKIE